MLKYNIIFTSPDNDSYLWNGASFDKLKSKEREVLFYSGKSLKEDDLADALQKCRESAKILFPKETDLKIRAVEIKVS